MRRALRWGILGGLSTAVACASVSIPRPSPSQTVHAQATWADATPESLEAGRTLYVTKCGGCHNLVVPASKRADQWPAFVEKMAPRAKLSAPQKESILRYLLAVTQTPP